MNIQAVGNHRKMVSFSAGFENVKPVEESRRKQSAKSKDDVQPSGGEGAETGEKGVTRLLLTGHFQSVADVRLRINFFEELQQRNTQSAQAAFEGGLPGLIDGLEAKARELFGFPNAATENPETETADPDNALDEALADFAGGADDILPSVKDGSLDLNTALKELRDAFSDLAETLDATFGAAPTPAVEDTDDGSTTITDVLETIPNEGEDVETAEAPLENAQTHLQMLETWFDDEVEKLEAAMSETQVLPPLSEPRGNGVAYSKFLEIYNSLTWGWKPESGTQVQAAGIDVLA